MSRPWQIWLTFAACLAIAIAAVGWLSVKALQTDAAQAEAAHQAAIEENARLALWRMDSFLAPIIAQENARPWNAFEFLRKGLSVSDDSTPYVLLHCQFARNGLLTASTTPAILARLDLSKMFAELPEFEKSDSTAASNEVGAAGGEPANAPETTQQVSASRSIDELSAEIRDKQGQLAALQQRLDSSGVSKQRAALQSLEGEIYDQERKCDKIKSQANAVSNFLKLPPSVVCLSDAIAPTGFLLGNVEVAAWLRVSDRMGLQGGTTYEQYRRTQAARIRSPLVLQEALNQAGISDLPMIRAEDEPRKFLEEKIAVVCPSDSELLQIKMIGADGEQLAKIVNAVKESFLKNVVEVEQHKEQQKLDILKSALKRELEILQNDRDQLQEQKNQLASVEAAPAYAAARRLGAEIADTEAILDRMQSQFPPASQQQFNINAAQLPDSQRGQTEYEAQSRNFAPGNSKAQNAIPDANSAGQMKGQPEIKLSIMKPLRMAGNLLLARRAVVGSQQYGQMSVLDWPAIKSQLLAEIKDLLPFADLQLVVNSSADSQSHQLASLPVMLIPGALPELTPGGLSPIKQSLIFAWGALILAALAAVAALRGVVSLSERRAAFVSAVTHELRTPLTTFRMYAEMLREGMVTNEADRLKYLDTLRVEADRLTHLVANVLAYARLERGRPGGRIETLSVNELLAKATERLADRATQANFQLSIEPERNVADSIVRADPTAVEQILFNLVDNACKYAASAVDRTLHLMVAKKSTTLEIRLSDHGPGVSSAAHRRLFQAFRKSAQEAAHSAPGVGLGLALSRRLARDMHGDLQYESATDNGACFILSLPLAQ